MKQRLLFSFLLAFSFAQTAVAQFTAGNLVVEQVGSGAAALSNASTAVYLKEFTTAGVGGNSVSIPSTGGNALTISGSAGSEGFLTRAADGSALVLAGYNTAAGLTGVATSTAASVPRAVGCVDAAGTYSLIAATTTAFSGNNIRSATSDGQGNYWAVGGTTGVVYFTASSTGTTISTTSTNNRVVSIFNGNLYISSGSGSFKGISQAGTGLPTTAGTTEALLVNDGSANGAYSYAFNAAGTVCYVADASSGIIKYTYSGGIWSQAYILYSTQTSGLTVDFTTANPTLYGVTSSGTTLFKVIDAGSGGATATTLATAPTNTAFRGVVFAPVAAAPPGSFTVSNQTGLTTLTAAQGAAGSPGSFQLSAGNLTAGASVATSNANFELAAASGGPYSSSVLLPQSGGGLTGQPVTIYVRISATAPVGSVADNLSVTSTGASSTTVSVSGTVTGPGLSASPTSLSGFSTTQSAASTAQTVTVTGSSLSASATATISGGYEFSTDGTTYQTSNITIPQSGGSLSQVLYVRIAPGNSQGALAGTIGVTSGSAAASVGLSGQVTQAYAAGNLVVEQVGSGAAALSNASTAVFLKEFTTAGVAVNTVSIPSTGSNALTISGTAGSEGFLTRAADGSALVLAGYNTAAGLTSVAGTTSATVPRAVGSISNAGAYSLVAASTTAFSSNNIRTAASDGLGNYWAVGGTTGVVYFTASGTGTTISTTSTNNRVVSVFNGNLFVSSSSGSFKGISQVGAGLPTTAGATATLLITDASPSGPYSYVFNAAGNVCYVADATSGIIKYTYNGTAWSQAYILYSTQTSGLTVDFTTANPTVYGVTTSGTTLFKVVDAGSGGATATTLATAPTNTAFRGVVFAPAPPAGTFTANNQTGLTTLTAIQGAAGSPGSFQLSAANLTANATVTSSNTDFELATASGGPYSSSVSLPQSGGGLTGQPVTIYVRISATAPVGNVADTISITSTGAIAATVYANGTVTGPMLTANPTSLSGFSTSPVAASAAQTVTITGSSLSSGATTTISGGYEFSTDGTTYQTSGITISQSGGSLSQVLYVRIASGNSSPGVLNGAVNVTSGSATATVSLSGQVTQLFAAGNLVVEQVGSGAAVLSNASTAVYLKEFTTAGLAGNSVSIPSTGSNALTISGSAGSEGFLTRAADGSALVLAGYNTAAGLTGVASTTSATVPRAVGSVNGAGTYSLIATTTTAFSGNNIRSATSDGQGNYWAVGGTTGVVYFTASGTGTTISTTSVNNRIVSIFNGNLYTSSSSGSFKGISQIGTGLPTTAGATAALLITDASSNGPYNYVFNSTGNVCYVADATSGIIKYTYNGTAWSQAYILYTTATSGLTIDFTTANPTIYGILSSGTTLFKVVDAGSGGATATTLATAPTNTLFRGVVFAPAAAAPAGAFTVTNQTGLSTLTAIQGAAGSPGYFQLSAANLTANATVASSNTSFELATASGGPYSSSVSLPQSGGGLSGQPVTIYVRISATAPVGNVADTIAITSAGAIAATVYASGTVTGPILSASPGSLSGFSSVLSATSVAQTVTLTGNNLAASGTATISGGYEFSTDGTTYQTSGITIPQSGGTFSQLLYVRLAAGNPTGNANGAITVTAGTASTTVNLYGQVTQPFGANNFVLVRVGDGTATLANTGNAVFLDEYTPAGVLVRSIGLPATTAGTNNRLVLSGTGTSEGFLNRSADGRYLTLTGYDSNIPAAGSLSSTAVNRTIGVINYNGYVDLTTNLSDLATGNNPRAAFTTNGTDLYAVGGANGLRYALKGTVGTSTQVSSTQANLRNLGYAEYGGVGQLFVSTSSGSAFRIGAVGTGTPATTGQTITNLPGLPTNTGPYQFYFADLTDAIAGADVLYIANDPNGATTGGGIAKYTYNGSTWSYNGLIDAASSVYRGLTGKVNANGSVTLYAVRGFDGANLAAGGDVVGISDASGYNGNPSGATITPLFSSGANSNKRYAGIAFAPVNTTCSGNTNVWEGNASANYSFSGNWCGGVPTATSDAIITADGMNLPRLATGNQSLHNLTVNAAAAFTVRSAGVLNVSGTIANSGTVDVSDGSLVFNGTSNQSIPAFAIKNISFNGAGFTLQGNLNIAGNLDFTSGKVTLGANSLLGGSNATLTGGNANSYAITNGTGTLHAPVGMNNVIFPVGLTAYNPAIIANNGAGATTTGFDVSVFNDVVDNGTTGATVTPPAVKRTWQIENDGSGTANATLTLQWNAGEDINSFDYNHVYIAHYNTNTNQWEGLTANAGSAPAAGGYPGPGPYSVTVGGVTSFSPFTAASGTALNPSVFPLPVTIMQLTAHNEGMANRIAWTTAEEKNLTSYDVEWSADGRSFTAIGAVAPTGSNSRYSFLHSAPESGVNYYRLRIHEANGSTILSSVVAAMVAAPGHSASLIPNPAEGSTTLFVSGEIGADAGLLLTDVAGHVLHRQAVTSAATEVSLQSLPAGLYFLRYVDGAHAETIRLTKQ